MLQDWGHHSFLSGFFHNLGQENRVRLKNPGFLLALVQILLIYVFYFKPLVIVTPRYLMFSTFSRTVPSNV